jgi:hypothetical protein
LKCKEYKCNNYRDKHCDAKAGKSYTAATVNASVTIATTGQSVHSVTELRSATLETTGLQHQKAAFGFTVYWGYSDSTANLIEPSSTGFYERHRAASLLISHTNCHSLATANSSEQS